MNTTKRPRRVVAPPDAQRCVADRKPLRDGTGARCMLPRIPGSDYCHIHATRNTEAKS